MATKKIDPVIAAAEKREAEELYIKIMAATDGIPRFVMSGSYQLAVDFKKHASAARDMATRKGNKDKVHKMREAWGLISGYYNRKDA